MAFDTDQLDSILEAASTSYGFRIRTTNAYQLSIALRGRISQARRTVHPEAFRALTIISSKSPLELYIVNKEQADAFRRSHGQAPNSNSRDGLPIAEVNLSEVGTALPSDPNSNSPPHEGTPGEASIDSTLNRSA
jgi:hypothetical protein